MNKQTRTMKKSNAPKRLKRERATLENIAPREVLHIERAKEIIESHDPSDGKLYLKDIANKYCDLYGGTFSYIYHSLSQLHHLIR